MYNLLIKLDLILLFVLTFPQFISPFLPPLSILCCVSWVTVSLIIACSQDGAVNKYVSSGLHEIIIAHLFSRLTARSACTVNLAQNILTCMNSLQFNACQLIFHLLVAGWYTFSHLLYICDHIQLKQDILKTYLYSFTHPPQPLLLTMKNYGFCPSVTDHGTDFSITHSRSHSFLYARQGHKITTAMWSYTFLAGQDPLQSMSLTVSIVCWTKLYLQHLNQPRPQAPPQGEAWYTLFAHAHNISSLPYISYVYEPCMFVSCK